MTQEIQLREKVFINGWEYWIDKVKMVIYPTEVAKNGIVYDTDGGTYVFSNHMTPNERKQVLDFIKYGR